MIEIAAKNPSITLFDWPYSNMVITGAMTKPCREIHRSQVCTHETGSSAILSLNPI